MHPTVREKLSELARSPAEALEIADFIGRLQHVVQKNGYHFKLPTFSSTGAIIHLKFWEGGRELSVVFNSDERPQGYVRWLGAGGAPEYVRISAEVFEVSLETGVDFEPTWWYWFRTGSMDALHILQKLWDGSQKPVDDLAGPAPPSDPPAASEDPPRKPEQVDPFETPVVRSVRIPIIEPVDDHLLDRTLVACSKRMVESAVLIEPVDPAVDDAVPKVTEEAWAPFDADEVELAGPAEEVVDLTGLELSWGLYWADTLGDWWKEGAE